MDSREKFNIKLMVDCERQEPFYPVTHASAILIIDDGELKNLQDIIGNILNFINTWGTIDISSLLTLGYTSWQAFPGNEGVELQESVSKINGTLTNILGLLDTLLPLEESVDENSLFPVTSAGIYSFIQTALEGITPDGIVEENNPDLVSGGEVYRYLWEEFLTSSVENNNDLPVTSSAVWNALQNLQPDGVVQAGNTHAVSGDAVNTAIQNLQTQIDNNSLWESLNGVTGSILQKNNLGLTVSNNNEVAIGTYNVSTQGKTLFSVGSGSGSGLTPNKNSIEITNDLTDSVIIPFNSSTVSIQAHMRNDLYDIQHISHDQLTKLELLIQDKWHAGYSFNISPTSAYYGSHNSLIFSGNIKPDVNITDLYDTLDDQQSYIRIICNNTVVYEKTSSSSNFSFDIKNASDNIKLSVYGNLGSSGKNTISFTLTGKGDCGYTIPSEVNKSLTLYAPSYAFSSDLEDLSSIPEDATPYNFPALSNFNVTVTITGSNKYIYLAVPEHIGNNINTNTLGTTFHNGPLPFSLDSSFGTNGKLSTSKTFYIMGKPVNTNYYILRSAEKLSPDSWNITT